MKASEKLFQMQLTPIHSHYIIDLCTTLNLGIFEI